MGDSLTIANVREGRRDPTNTLGLRRRFGAEMYKRFRELKGVIRKAIIQDDVFGLKHNSVTTQQLSSPGARRFAFSRSQQKAEGFMDWLRHQQERGILEVTRMEQMGMPVEEHWSGMYVKSAYRKGLDRGHTELRRAGHNVPTIDELGGIDAVFHHPQHLDRAGSAYTRVFSELRGVTEAMDQQISRKLAEGLTQGWGPGKMAKEINGRVDSIGLNRARTIARTETIRAHHSAMVQEYRNWGAVGVRVKAEWKTANYPVGFGPLMVCPDCAALEGRVYTLEEIEALIPLHPNCRCIALPLDVTDEEEE